LELLADIDKLLSTHEGFLLGPWLKEARNWGSNEEEKRLLERNLKRQITIWGQSSSGDTELSDYANRQWSGPVRTFYKERCALVRFISLEITSDCLGGGYGWRDVRLIWKPEEITTARASSKTSSSSPKIGSTLRTAISSTRNQSETL